MLPENPLYRKRNMQFQEHSQTGGWEVETDGEGRLKINGRVFESAVCLAGGACRPAAERTPQDLSPASFEALPAEGARPEVVIVGTGAKQQFLHPRLNAALAAHGIGIEYMSTAAACRTLMMLQSEGREVWAWLWPSEKAV